MTDLFYQIISDHTDRITSSLIETRRQLYMYPELSGKEEMTSQFIARRLESLGLEVKPNVGGHGVIGLLRGGREGKTVAWRADIDALPIQDTIDKPYKSRIDGVKHACGHDVHTAIALGIAEVLATVREQIPGTVMFIFQPYEEGGEGALQMTRDGVFGCVKPDEVNGLHVNIDNNDESLLETGKIRLQYGTALFGVNYLSMHVSFLSGRPDLDAEVQRLADLLSGLNQYQIQSLEQKDHNTINFRITDSIINKAENSISIKALYRFAIQKYKDEINKELTRLLDRYSRDFNAHVNMHITKSIPPVYNQEHEALQAEGVLTPIIGRDLLSVHTVPPLHGYDDFAVFQNDVGAGLFFFLGAANAEKGIRANLHTAGFDVDEDCIPFGVKTMACFLYQRLLAR